MPKGHPEYIQRIHYIARKIAGFGVGLVLGRGATIGLAHISVLKVLEQEKIPIDIVAGSSMGALIAAFWVIGYSTEKLERVSCGFQIKLKTLKLIDPTLPVRGLVKGKAVRKFLTTYLEEKKFF